jgi:hypothetical protein
MQQQLYIMKKQYLIYACVSLLSYTVNSQVTNTSGSYLVQTGNSMVFRDINLVNNGTFNATDGTARFTGTGTNAVSGSTSPLFHTLEINKSTGNQLTLQRNISVNNYIDFVSGLIELSGNNIVLNGSAYLNNESENSRITGITGGYVQTTAILNAPAAVNPGNLGAVITTAQNMGTTIIRRGHQSQANSYGTGNSIYRYYDILPATSPSSLTFRVNYFDAELNGLNESNLVIVKSNDTLTWLLEGYTSRDASANYVEYAGITNFTQRWTLSTDGNALPLELLSFKTACANNAVNLNWTTSDDINSTQFQVQRSNDGVQWQAISTITANNTQYAYTDVHASSTSAYRLKITDAEGKSTFSIIRSPGCAISSVNTNLYPNPATNYLVLQLNNMPAKEMLLTLVNNAGQIVLKKNLIVATSKESYTIPLHDLPAGMYHASIKSNGYQKTLAFIKQGK